MSRWQPSFDFMRLRGAAFVLSIVLLVIAIGALAMRGLNMGLDFTGGTLLEVGFAAPVSLNDVRDTLAESGFPRASVVHFGSEQEVLIRLPGEGSAQTVKSIVDGLSAGQEEPVTLRRSDLVGPQMGDEMAGQGVMAVLASFVMMMLYVSMRFQWKLSAAAVLGLLHDVLITVGAFALFGWEVDLSVLAAVLALIGYSINDTIVVYDRIRENVRKMRRMDLETIANASINQTLSRTLMTSLTTLLAVLALLFFGGDTLRGFALVLTISIVVGTYSSIYIAVNLAFRMGLDRTDLMLAPSEQGEVHDSP